MKVNKASLLIIGSQAAFGCTTVHAFSSTQSASSPANAGLRKTSSSNVIYPADQPIRPLSRITLHRQECDALHNSPLSDAPPSTPQNYLHQTRRTSRTPTRRSPLALCQSFFRNVRRLPQKLRKFAFVLTLSAIMLIGSTQPSFAAVSGGRMGGRSFSSSSPSHSATHRIHNHRHHHRHNHHHKQRRNNSARMMNQRPSYYGSSQRGSYKTSDSSSNGYKSTACGPSQHGSHSKQRGTSISSTTTTTTTTSTTTISAENSSVAASTNFQPRSYSWTTPYFGRTTIIPPQRTVFRSSQFSVADRAILSGTGVLFVYGLTKNKFLSRYRRGGDDSPSFGDTRTPTKVDGATTTSLTLSLNVADRENDRSAILNRLRDIALQSDTSTREGVQQLLEETAVELLRKQDSIVAAVVESNHFRQYQDAERDFDGRSIQHRRKMDEETVSNFGGRIRRSDSAEGKTMSYETRPRATQALVTLHMTVEGKGIFIPSSSITTLDSVVKALEQLATEVSVSRKSVNDTGYLLAGEVLWMPETQGEVLYPEDTYRLYPELKLLV